MTLSIGETNVAMEVTWNERTGSNVCVVCRHSSRLKKGRGDVGGEKIKDEQLVSIHLET